MKFYEMVFKKSFEDYSRRFYKQNNINTRASFLIFLREEITIELMDFKKNCNQIFLDDLVYIYEQVLVDSIKYLDALQDKFVCEGYAEFDDLIYLRVYERIMIDNDKVKNVIT